MMDRRTLLAGGMLAALAAGARAHSTAPPMARVVRLTVGARTTDMTMWTPAVPKAVALFSTGHGSWPERYEALAQLFARQGVATLAPTHVDSLRHPDRERFTREASFGERIADLTAASAQAARLHPGLPVIAAGHSFGSLTALCLAGGLGYLGPFRDPSVRAVLAFSTPGRIPGLIRPDAYAAVSIPLLTVTGTADLVPGLVTDPADHLLAADTVSGPSYALVLAGGTHEMVGNGDRRFDRARPMVDLFLQGHALGNAAARSRLTAFRPAAGDRFLVRNGK